MITITNVSKKFTQGKEVIRVLEDISFEIPSGKTVAIVGPSGSGKSTLLSIIAGLDSPDTGTVVVDGAEVHTLSEEELSVFRNKKVSIIFQSFELVPFFTAYENVMLPLSIRGKQNKPFVDQLFEDVKLSHRKNNLPSELSGGEQQRVAIARVLAAESDIIFADEPTGNLDNATGQKILNLLLSTVKKYNKTLIMITHDMSIAKQMDCIYEMHNGNVRILE